MPQTHDDVSVLTLDASNYLSYLGHATVRFTNRTAEGQGVGDMDKKACITKKSCEVDLDLMSDDANCRVTGLNVSAFTIASIDFKDALQSLSMTIQNEFKETDGVADTWVERTWVNQGLSATVECEIPSDASTLDDVVLGAASGTLSNANAALSVTINSVTVTWAMVVTQAEHVVDRGDVQTWRFTLETRGAPSAPVGTATLLAKALNGAGTDQALVLESKASKGVNYSGNFLPETVSFTVNKQDVVMTAYKYVNNGAVTAAATA